MLGFLKGKTISKNLDGQTIVVLAHRIGFEVTVPKVLFETLILNETISLWLHSHVREDQFTLFGFASESEKHLFRVLLGVSGLGPKTALSLLGEHGASRVCQLIMSKDSDSLSEAPGVGKKLAQKVILELSGKVEKFAWLEELPKSVVVERDVMLPPDRQLREDLNSALVNLGFVPNHIKITLDKLFERENVEAIGFAEALKAALKEMSGRGRPTEMSHG